jgi:acyl-CoA thioesterase-1
LIGALLPDAIPADDSAPVKPRARRVNPALAKIEDDPKLPRVLLIGDSISIGYTLPVREALKGRANLHRIPANGGPTTRGLEAIDEWLGQGRWDVIHFNWGLHDLKYVDAKGSLSASTSMGQPQVSLEAYEQNLDRLVSRLKQTGARLIFATTTPVPEGAAGRIPADADRYNAAARRVMQRHGVTVNDLYAFAQPKLAEIQLPANVHFTPAGSQALAQPVAQAIAAALPDR